MLDPGEACDDGNQNDGDECTNDCTEPLCGDGIVHDGVEACDDGNPSDADACLPTCVVAECGDGIVHAGVEGCDDANQVDDDGCSNTCVLPDCGDGLVQMGEQCDDANDVDTDDCLGVCTIAVCGDSLVHDGFETCDDGGDSMTCDDDCTPAICGDVHVNPQAGETCDEVGDTATCDDDCTDPQCGDGHVNQAFNESCDDAGESLVCDDDCSPAMCGDGNANAAAGEQCDTSGQSATCDADCTTAVCGDGQINVSAGEVCDDGNMEEGDGCSSLCKPHKIVFATSVAFDGALGGLDGADAKCQQLAIAAGLKGIFRAWLSDMTGSPSTRFTKSTIPYVRRDGKVVATDWADLTDGFVTNAINLSEIKTLPGSDANKCGNLQSLVLTDTATDGTLFNEMGTCANWTSAAANLPTGGGHYPSLGATWSAYLCIYTCNWKKALYCFQQ